MKRRCLGRQVTAFLLFLGILFYFAIPVRTVFAYSGNGDLVVHVTSTGECYHLAGCGYLRSDIEMPLEEAYITGYRPCSRCKPPVYTGNASREVKDNKNAQKSSGQNTAASVSKSVNDTEKTGNRTLTLLLGAGGTIAVVVAVKKSIEAKRLKEELQRQKQEDEKQKR